MGQISTTYAAYLRSPHWRGLTAWLHLRCMGRCEACGHDASVWPIDGHHLLYRARLEDGVLADLLALCRRCHDIVHDLKIPDLFAFGEPVDRRRARTIDEIRRYLHELCPPPIPNKTPHRVFLKQQPRVSGTMRTRYSKRERKLLSRTRCRIVAENQVLAERQAHLRRH